MTDIEMTRLCAEAMGWEVVQTSGGYNVNYTAHTGAYIGEWCRETETLSKYDPLHDDAQTMALMKKFHADICWSADAPMADTGVWYADCGDNTSDGFSASNRDVNRAIVECVAKMQAAKQ